MTARRRLSDPYRVRSGRRQTCLRAVDGLLKKLVKMQMHFRRRRRQVVRKVGFGEKAELFLRALFASFFLSGRGFAKGCDGFGNGGADFGVSAGHC